MNKLFNKLHLSFIDFINVQLFLTLISMPVLIAWGLPISLLTPVGNMIFTPVLTLFLLLSSVIFFTEFVSIPNTWFIWALEMITWFWQKATSYNLNCFLVGFKKPHWFILVMIPIITIIILMHPSMRNPIKKMMSLFIFFVCMWLFLRISTPDNRIVKLDSQHGLLNLIQCKGTCVLIDQGAIGARISAPSYVSFTLVPEIIKCTGSLCIDHLIVAKPGIVLFEALEQLLTKMEIHHIYLPYLHGTMDDKFKRAFNRFYRLAKSQNCSIIPTRDTPISIYEENLEIQLIPEKKVTYRDITYQSFNISGSIDNERLNFYDSDDEKPL